METLTSKLSIAVVGAGIAGITAAYLLGKQHDVTLIERNTYVGGHTNTIRVPQQGGEVSVDTGFIVCNPKTYPNFYRLLAEWGVAMRDSDMSFGYYCESSGLGYVGPSMREFSRRFKNFFNPAFLGMILEQRRFNQRALADLELGILDDVPLGDYLKEVRATPFFVNAYLLPLAAAVWSSPGANMLQFPASTFIRFFNNHGMLDLKTRPTWQTVVGGSQTYVRAFRAKFRGEILQGAPVRAVQRNYDGVTVHFHDRQSKSFDRVVMAAHADESLKLLCDPDFQEQHLLSAWTYHRNSTLLHTDASVLPRDRRLWASWNYCQRADELPGSPVSITYYMNRLQGLKTERDYLVSLNANHIVDPASVIYSVEYTHPAYTNRSIAAQCDLRRINGTNHTYFCGSYMGYGFHEDAVSSAVEVAKSLGVTL